MISRECAREILLNLKEVIDNVRIMVKLGEYENWIECEIINKEIVENESICFLKIICYADLVGYQNWSIKCYELRKGETVYVFNYDLFEDWHKIEMGQVLLIFNISVSWSWSYLP